MISSLTGLPDLSHAGNDFHCRPRNAKLSVDPPRAVACGERAYTGTRIDSAGGVRYEHDPAGRMTLRQKPRLSRKPDTWRYEWDTEDRLTACTTPDGARWIYTYDALGRRTAKYRLGEAGPPVEAQPAPIERVDPDAIHPDSEKRTWAQQFRRRMNHQANRDENGNLVPPKGLKERPRHVDDPLGKKRKRSCPGK